MKKIYLYTFNKRLWLAIALSLSLFYKVVGDGLEVDAQAPTSQQPAVETANTGVPIVNITEPTPGGVSHNTFVEYNVGTEGIIFNNNADQSPDPSGSPTLSELAKEPLFINDNLHGRAAQVILTEVSGVNISKLLGPTEIYGHSSDFIVANPNGIYCNGASFINAHRITLTTAKPQLTHEGVLQALQVDKGIIEIVDKGISTALIEIPTNPLEILSRAVQIRGTIASHDAVHIYTGMNKYDYATKKLTALNSSATSNNSYVAIDASLLADIRAKKIILIATEQGAGVNCPNLTAAGDNIEITAAGDIKLKEIYTAGNLLVNSQQGNIEQQAKNTTVYKDCQLQACQGNISLATGTINITGNGQFSSKQLTIAPTTQLWIAEGATSTNATLHVAIQEKIYNHGKIYVPHLKVEPLQDFINTGQLATQYDLSIVSQQLINQGTIDAKEGRCELTGHLAITNDKIIRGKNGLTLHTKGTLENKGQLLTEHDLELHANNIAHTGKLLGKRLKLVTSEALTNQGFLVATQEGIEIQAGDFVNHGKVIGTGKILAKTRSLHHTGTIISEKNSIDLETTGPITSQGEIYGQVGIKVKSTGGDIIHSGTLKTPGEVEVQALHIVNTGILSSTDNKIKLEASQGIENQQLITGKKSVTITTQGYVVNKNKLVSEEVLTVHAMSLTNTGHMYGKLAQNLDVQDILDNAGTINTHGSLVLMASKVTNQGIISAQQKLDLQANSVENKKEINSLEGQVSLQVKETLTNQLHAAIKSKKGMEIEVKEWMNQGQIIAEGTLEAKVAATIINQGVLTAQQNVTIQAQNLENAGSIGSHQGTTKLTIDQGLVNQKDALVSSAQDIEVTANELTNQGELKSQQNLQATVNNKFTNKGVVTVQQDLTLKTQSFDNFQEISTEKGAIKLTIDQSFTNQQAAFVNSTQDLTIQAAQITNQGDIISGKSIGLVGEAYLVNQGLLIANENLTIQAAKLTNEQAIISQTGGIKLTINQSFTNSKDALVNSAQDLNLQADIVANHGKIQTGGVLDVQIRSFTNIGKIQGTAWQSAPFQQIENRGLLEVIGDLVVTSGSLYNAAILSSKTGKVAITLQGDFTNEKLLHSGTDVHLQVGGKVLNPGMIHAAKSQHMTANSLENPGTILAEAGTSTLQVTQEIHNKGQIKSHQSHALKASSLINEGKIVSATDQLTLDITGELNNQGYVYTPIALTITAGTLTNAHKILSGGMGQVRVSGNLTNTAEIAAHKNLEVQAQELHNSHKILSATGQLTAIAPDQVSNSGELESVELLKIQTKVLNNAASGKLITDQVLQLDSLEQFTNTGEIQALRMEHTGTPSFTNTGTFELQEGSTLNTQDFTNKGDITLVKGDLHITSQQDITLAKGKITTQQGNLYLTASKGNLYNTSSTLFSGKDMTLEVGKTIDNKQQISTQNNLTIKSHTLTNTGEIQAKTGRVTLELEGNLQNTNKIMSAGNVEIKKVSDCINTGQLKSGATLHIQATNLENKSPGILQAKTVEIAVTDHLLNAHAINGVQELTIQAGRMNNSGKLSTNGTLGITIQQGNLDNTGTISSNKSHATLIIEKGSLTNAHELKSADNLTIRVEQGLLDNIGQLIAAQQLDLKVQTLDNSGKMSGGTRASIRTTGNLTNSNILGSAQVLEITAGGQLKNTNKGKIATIKGKLVLQAYNLYNAGEIYFGSGQDSIQVSDVFEHSGTIKGRGELQVNAGNRIENRGEIVAEKELRLKAPVIQHMSGILQSNQGNLTLTATTRFENRSQLVTFHELIIETRRLENHTKLYSAHDLKLIIPELENTQEIAARGKLTLQLETLTNRGKIIGGHGDNTIEVKTGFINHGEVATAGSLTVKGLQRLQLHVQNHQKLTANGALTIYAKNLTNHQLIQGGPTTRLQISGKISNGGKIASIGDLYITAQELRAIPYPSAKANLAIKEASQPFINRLGSKSKVKLLLQAQEAVTNSISAPVIPTLQANHDITLQVHELSGHEIKGGEGNTALTIQRGFTSRHSVSSLGNLSITTAQLDNYSDIIAAKTLVIQASQIINQEKGLMQGGKEQDSEKKEDETSRPLESKLESQGDIHNKGKIVSLDNLTLQSGKEMTNKGMVQAGNRLYISAHTVSNAPAKTITSGQDIVIQVSYITNQEGEIFANQNMTLEGPGGGYAEKVSNLTRSKQAHMKAMGDMTIKAKRLENRGHVEWDYGINTSYDDSWYTNASDDWIEVENSYTTIKADDQSRLHGWDGTKFSRSSKEAYSKIRSRPARIEATKNLFLYIQHQIDNNDSQLLAGVNIHIGSNKYTHDVPENRKNILDLWSVLHKKESQGPSIYNRTYSSSVTIDDAYIYEKTWNLNVHGFLWIPAFSTKYDCIRKYREPKTFTFYAPEASIIRAGSNVTIKARGLENGTALPKEEKVVACADPLKGIAASKTISTSSSIELPQGQYGMFILQLDPYAPDPTQPKAAPQVQVNQVDVPTFSAPAMAKVDTDLDIFLAELLAPQTPEFEDIREAAERARTTTLGTEDLDELPSFTSQASTTNTYTTHLPKRTNTSSLLPTGAVAADPGAPSYDLPTDPDLSAEDPNLNQQYHGNYQPAPAKEKIKLNFLPPLIRTNTTVDQSKFYGSPYFLRHVGLDPGQRGTIGKPFRFLGDPFYESRLINDAILKSTARQFLYNDVATLEEQVKCLIDNTAEVTKDMKVSLGVALSKEQINSLKKDILWYVEEEVANQKVLVPQVYLTKQTINNLRVGKGAGIHSGGKMELHVSGALTNTGNISAQKDLTVRAESLRNESFGKVQATIQSTGGAVDLETKKNINNLSGKISGKTETRVVSIEGAIRNETKLLNDSTLHLQASIESESKLTMKAKGDIINKGSKVKAVGNATIISETGDVQFLTQETKKEDTTHTRSPKGGRGKKKHTSSDTTHRSTKHAVSGLEVGGNVDMQGRDLVFMGTDVKVGGNAAMKASRNFKALAVQDLEETSTHSEENTKESGVFSSKSSSKTNSSYHKKSTSKGPKFNIVGGMKVEAKGNADFEGANVEAGSVEMDVQGETTIRKAYNEDTYEDSSSEDNKEEAVFGLFKDNKAESSKGRKYDKTGTGNNWDVKGRFKVIGKGDVTTQGMNLTAHTIHFESTEGNVADQAVEEIHEDHQEENKYKEKQGLLGFKAKKEEGRLSLELRKKEEEKSIVSNNKKTAQSSNFKTTAVTQITEDGKTVTVEGSATFKAAKKVILEGTETDIAGKLSLQGKEGVEVIAKKETEEYEEHKETYTEEFSIGVKNSIVAAVFQAKAVKQAIEAEVIAIKNYSKYREQLKEAEKLYKSGEISKDNYKAVKSEEKFHLAATAAATLALATKTKKFLSNAASAAASLGSTWGFSVDLQGDINKTVDNFIRYEEKAKGSKIKTKQLEIVTDNTFKVVGSQIHAQESEITAKDMVVEAFKGAEKSENSGNSKGGNVTVGLAPTLSLDMSANFETREGKSKGVQHTNSLLNLGKLKLNIENDVTIQGGQIKTTTVEGIIGGNLHVETLQDTNEGKNETIGVSMGVGVSRTIGNNTLGGNYSYGKHNKKWSKEQSGFTSTDEFKLDVKNKTTLVGASLGSEKVGKTAFTTKELEKRDIDGYQKSTEWGLGVNLTSTYKLHNKPKLAGEADAYYKRSNTFQKVTSSIGEGTKDPLTYLDTQSQVKVDSDMAELVYGLVVDRRKVGKKIVEDLQAIIGIGRAEVLVVAETAEESESTMDAEGDQLQKEMGVEDPATI